jgi:hypothetical protein
VSAELEHYQPAQGTVIPITGGTVVAPLPPATDVDGWITVIAQVAQLAERIADTDFVPDALRRKPAAITAAILSGREMGVAPMTALQHINVIKGKPGQDALLMRALVLSKGHLIEYGDCNDTRALVRGKRRDEDTWTEVVFTADQARRAKIDLGGYPEDKLIARATSRLCRRKFADVISGMSYTLEELQDGDVEFVVGDEPATTAPAEPTPAPAERTAQRRSARPTAAKTTATSKTSAPGKTRASAAGAATPAAADPRRSGPPLPGEDDYDEPPAEEQAPGPVDTDPSTKPQNAHMHALFREAEVSDRDERLKLTGLLLNRQLDTSKGLTVADARGIIDALVQLKESGHEQGLAGAVNDMLNMAALADADGQDGEQAVADDDDTRDESAS